MKADQETDFVTQVTSLVLINFLKVRMEGKKNVSGLKKTPKQQTLRSVVRFLGIC